MTIWTGDQYRAAQARIADPAGCLEDNPRQGELIALQLAAEVWEAKVGEPTARSS